jgi:hypothetical protein
MSGTSATSLPVLSKDSDRELELTLSEKSKEASTEIERTEDNVGKRSKGPTFVSSITKDEPVVTRKELWSYYCAFTSLYLSRKAC